MYLSVRSVWAKRMVSSDSLVSQARDVWIKPPLTIRDMRFLSDLGSRIIAAAGGVGCPGLGRTGGSGSFGAMIGGLGPGCGRGGSGRGIGSGLGVGNGCG